MAELKTKTVCFDLDGVICSQTTGDYENAVPNPQAIRLINGLYAEGFRIIIHTARFMARNNGNPIEAHRAGYDFTVKQLRKWGVNFHDLFLGKPVYDIVIDDRAVFYRADWEEIHRRIRERCL